MKRTCLLSLAIAALLFATPAAHAQRADGIAAVVNDGIVTKKEIEDRIDLILSSSGMLRQEKFRAGLRPEVTDTLITELVQVQAAKSSGITVDPQKVQAQIAKIAVDNKMSPTDFKKMLAKQHVNVKSLERQIESQIAWVLLVQKDLRPQIMVSDAEIAAEKQQIIEHAGQTEYQLAEIYLPFDAQKSEAQALAFGQKLVADMKKGARFSELARQFSRGASAASGGLLGWLRDDQLDPLQSDAVKKLSPKMPLSDPVRGDGGYHIFLLLDARKITAPASATVGDAQFSLRDLAVPVEGGDVSAAMARADQIRRENKTCEDAAKIVSQQHDLRLVESQLKLSEMDGADKTAAAAAQPNTALPVQQRGDVAVVRYICAREDQQGSAVDEEIANNIGNARLDILAKRYLRDLMANALIERRK